MEPVVAALGHHIDSPSARVTVSCISLKHFDLNLADGIERWLIGSAQISCGRSCAVEQVFIHWFVMERRPWRFRTDPKPRRGGQTECCRSELPHTRPGKES